MLKWPSRLVEDAHELHGFSDPSLTEALEDAVPSIIDIISGRRPFPILQDFRTYLAATVGGNKIARASNFRSALSVPLLLGDESLIDPFVTRLHQSLVHNPSNGVSASEAALLASAVGGVLFSTVIVRSYLERPAEDDQAIYCLLMSNIRQSSSSLPSETSNARIIRRLTVPEEALATVLRMNEEERCNPGSVRQLSTE